MWFLFASLAGLFFTAETLIARHLLRDRSDAWAYSFYFSLIGTIVTFPYFLTDPVVPGELTPWLLTIAVGVLIVVCNLAIFSAAKYLEPSLSGSIGKLKLVWVFFLSVAFLGTPMSWLKLLGVLLTVAAGVVIMGRFRKPSAYRGVALMVIASLAIAGIVVLSKYLFEWFNTPSLTFFVSYLPAVFINYALMPNRNHRIVDLFKAKGRLVVAGAGVGALANVALNQALSLGEASAVIVVMEACLIAVWAGEHAFLKEREGKFTKLAAVALAVAGAILMQTTT